MQTTGNRKLRLLEVICFIGVLSLVLFNRYLILRDFGFVYTDGDQTILWGMLSDYTSGIFNEPGFYGQAYNSGIEAMFAVPLYKCGIPAHRALPIVSTFMCIFPFVIIAWFTFLKRSPFTSLIILSLPLLLPNEYGLITCMPRGFVPGLFFAGLSCLAVFYPSSKWWLSLSVFFAITGYVVNSSSIIVTLPCLLYLWLCNVKQKRYYLYSGIGLFCGALIYFGIKLFYASHPNYVVHTMELDYSFKRLAKSFSNLDIYFNFNTPVFHAQGYLVLFMFAFLAAFYYLIKKKSEALVCLFIPVFILITFGINKIHEGFDSIFFHYSRMFLSVPLALALCLSLFKPEGVSRIYLLWLIVPVKFFFIARNSLPQTIEKRIKPGKREAVIVASVSRILGECFTLRELSRQYKVDLIIISFHFFYDQYNYGCAACMSEFPKTLRPAFERRVWRMLEDEHKIYSNVLVIDTSRDFSAEFNGIKKVNYAHYLVSSNRLKTSALLDSLKIYYRPYN